MTAETRPTIVMVIQPRPQVFRCFRQHDHALVSGALARAWRFQDGTAPSFEAALAIASHDIGWVAADASPIIHDAADVPRDFITLPWSRRLKIYRAGIDTMERLHAYAGILGSIHFSAFASDENAPEFAAAERERRNRLIGELPTESTAALSRDYSLLKALDLASLFVCLTQPGSVRDAWPAWIENPMHVEGREHALRWEDDTTIVCTPSRFAAPVHLTIPYVDLPRPCIHDPAAVRRHWNGPVTALQVTVR